MRVDTLLSLAIPALVVIHLVVAPYTKVEESFNLQAAHDILVYGTPTKDVHTKLSTQYDHFDFPGAVPRTFLGPVLLAGFAQPIVALIGFEHAQFVVRAVLGLFNAWSLLFFKSRVAREFGEPTARWYAVLQASQFHVLFYASRTLPNMFAFGLTTLAFAQLVGNPNTLRLGQCKLAIALLTFATAIFRSELAILLCTTTAYLFLVRRLPAESILEAHLISFVLSLLVSVPLDSYFWQKPVWPELWGFVYNVIRGSSSDWGVSPWHYYFTNALPKILTNPLVLGLLLPLSLSNPATKAPARALTIPTFIFMAVYSFQPHKEARFIFYVAPPLTAAAALGANYIFTRRAKSILYSLASLALVASVAGSFIGSSGMLVLSSLNYPGGEALSELRALVTPTSSSADVQTVMVHTDVLSCMTGVTLFGQHQHPPNVPKPAVDTVAFVFDKTERPATLSSPAFWSKFDYLLLEDPTKAIGSWQTIGFIEGFAGVEVLKPGMEAKDDLETGRSLVLGRGATIKKIRETVRGLTGGWWIGPRMEPQIRILKKSRGPPRKEVKE
ncbi:putative Mannosyltransferase [Seiridium cardinale]|uniref:Mannosyltransferase n=1 Tax=Seiridium cardinale TaxID=138064 RepID=A0ABR2XCG5_9PEZI